MRRPDNSHTAGLQSKYGDRLKKLIAKRSDTLNEEGPVSQGESAKSPSENTRESETGVDDIRFKPRFSWVLSEGVGVLLVIILSHQTLSPFHVLTCGGLRATFATEVLSLVSFLRKARIRR